MISASDLTVVMVLNFLGSKSGLSILLQDRTTAEWNQSETVGCEVPKSKWLRTLSMAQYDVGLDMDIMEFALADPQHV